MASLTESIKFSDAAPNDVIRCLQFGSFLRVYDRSAWLFHCVFAKYKVIRSYVKGLQRDTYFIGFPEKSLLQHIDGRTCTKTEYGFDIQLSADEIPAEEEYDNWKLAVEVVPISKKAEATVPPTGKELETEVCRIIREYPLDIRTPVDCMMLVKELRMMLLSDVPQKSVMSNGNVL